MSRARVAAADDAAGTEHASRAALDAGLTHVRDAPRGRGRVDGSAEPEHQLTLMSSRAVALVAGPVERWPLAGDQLYVDLDLSVEHLPAGTRLRCGTAVIELTAPPHTGCDKFRDRFGIEVIRWIGTDEGRSLRLRGVNARIVTAGIVRTGDDIVVTPAARAAAAVGPRTGPTAG